MVFYHQIKRISILITMVVIFTGNAYCQAQDIILNSSITTSQTITATRSITLNPGFSASGTNGMVLLKIVPPTLFNCTPLNTTLTSNLNYVSTYVPRVPLTDAGSLSSHSVCDVNQTIQYIDGLGRPVQTIQVKANPDGTKDMIQAQAYDSFGREAVKYLPYTISATTPGAYHPAALSDAAGNYPASEQYAFYHPATSQNYSPINTPVSPTAFEPSPMNRPVEQGAPGDPWQLTTSGVSGAGNTVKMTYGLNDASSLTDGTGFWAKQYGVNVNASTGVTNLVEEGVYGTNQLTVTVTKDENWTAANGKLHTTEEYKDKSGHVVLKRTFNSKNGNFEILSTYYVYDDLDNLTYVLPPGANADAGNIAQTTLDNFCYQYQYDERKRLIKKKIPGSGWMQMVYNILDQLVATQDANHAGTEWTITKYDALGRVIITGLWDNNISQATLQSNVNAQASQWEVRDNTQTNGYTLTNTYPSALTNILTINYYDDYNVVGLPTIYDHHTENSPQTTGLLTASKVNVLGTTDMLWTVNYYDDKGRITNTYNQHYLGGTNNLSTNNYDYINNHYNFTNQVTNTTRQHYSNGNGSANLAVTVVDSVVYDNIGRKRQTWSRFNNNASVLLSQVDFNEMGQTFTKHLHSTDNGNSFLQNISYGFNERGWLINQKSAKYNLSLAYNTNITTGATPQFNGNITEMYSTSDKTDANSRMKYTYDALNRLTAADHTNGLLTENGINYDVMGNINTLNRTGAANAQLNYSYNGNQLMAVSNNAASYRSYGYDANGNATTDGGINGNAKTISYNILNLPQSITTGNATIATYIYEAAGNKIRNTGSDGTWDYINGIVYHNGSIAFIGTEEGRAIPNGGANYNYQYNLKDHLGNVRVSIDNTGVLQEDEYYAFGLRNSKYDASNNNRYLYNGKERQTDLTDQYDYGARFYDPVIARWTTPDPLAEKSRRWSPYTYAINNPIRFIDPDGKEIINIEGGVRFTGDDAKVAFSAIKQQSESKGGISGIHFVREAKTPTIYKDALTAFRLGKPNVLHYLSDKEKQDENRDNAIGGYPKKTSEGLERQEYPYASTYEGGEGAYVTYVPSREQRVEGGQLGVLYRTLNDGDSFLVLPVPRDKEPDAQKQPSPVPFPMPSREATKNVATGVGIGTAAYILYKVIVGAATWECGGCGVFVTP